MASFKAINLLSCHFLATGRWNMFTVCPEEQFKLQSSHRKRNNYNQKWTNTWKSFEFWEKTQGVWAKTFWQRCQNWNLHVQVFILRKVFSWGKNLISKISWISTKKKHNSTLSDDFCGKSLFLSHLMAKSRPSSELPLVKKLPFDSKVWRKPNFVYLIAEKLWKNFINATKSKKQMNLSFPVIVHIKWKSIENAGEKMKKMKVRETFWNTKIHLSFQPSSAAALMKILSDGKFIKILGLQVIRSESVQIVGDLDNGEWKKKSHRTATFKAIKLLPCHFLATVMWNMYTVCPEEQFKVQTSLRKRKNYNHIWTNTWKFFEFWERSHGVWAKTFWKHCQNWNLHVQVFFCEKFIPEAKI